MWIPYCYFNPRSHEGSDSQCCTKYPINQISIHAPTRGATLLNFWICVIPIDFNPRSHEGSDQGQMLIRSSESIFQSTLPRGERPGVSYRFFVLGYFNPRSHEGSDSNFRQKVLFSLSKNCLKYLILTTNYFN